MFHGKTQTEQEFVTQSRKARKEKTNKTAYNRIKTDSTEGRGENED